MTFAISTPATSLRELTVQAVRAGKTHLVGVGGDGTHHHIINALAKSDLLPVVTYAPLSLGSGNDWIRSLGTPTELPGWLAYLSAGTVRKARVGTITFEQTGNTRYFINVAGFAYDAEIVRIAEEERVRKRWMYPILAAAYLNEYRAPAVHVAFGREKFSGKIHTVNVGLGRYSGGGMSFVPHANLFGEALALTIIPRLPAWKVVASSWRLYNGSVGSLPEAITTHTPVVKLSPFLGELECEADGEWLGTGAVRVGMHEEAVRVVTKA